MKKYIFITAIVLLFTTCENKNECEKIDTSPIISSQQATLENTMWKLAGFVDMEEGCLKRAEPNDEGCYHLNFDTDSTLTGVAASNQLMGRCEIDYATCEIHIAIGNVTCINELFDGNRYIADLNKIQSFSVKGDELRLYYNNKKNYLLYKTRQS
ncbi:META domain-containing protein [Bacteroidales bacterium OttesenSCG-928-B11]|nr:META domain-containing protein [Bacteroidales bacterium OttesenSCG-928-E04]MDL2308196.1 META domain-containing protein [Bacteroidales bacterium OttesenSCG-928-C03]MDL2312590.1 META domain-containing protein [Bacteroidales bacterium OttesenSCG-928-B11]MDL2325634.1 META domain-containing protein [Bacteroidales bacterium OttesenSCG-928-A14]